MTVTLCLTLFVFLVSVTSTMQTDAVLELSEDNVDRMLNKHTLMLVAFWAPWCGHSSQLLPEFVAAAAELRSRLPCASVDGIANPSLVKRFKVGAYPTIKVIRSGVGEEFGGGRTAPEIVKWVVEHVVPTVHVFSPSDDIFASTGARRISDTWFLCTGDDDFLAVMNVAVKAFQKRTVQPMSSVGFVKADNTTLRALRGWDEVVFFNGSFDAMDELEDFLVDEELALVAQVDETNFLSYHSVANKGIVWFCLATQEVKDAVTREREGLFKLARRYRNEIPFLWINPAEYPQQVLEDLRCPVFPMVVVQLGNFTSASENTVVKYRRALSTNFTAEEVGFFLSQVLAGHVRPFDELDELEVDALAGVDVVAELEGRVSRVRPRLAETRFGVFAFPWRRASERRWRHTRTGCEFALTFWTGQHCDSCFGRRLGHGFSTRGCAVVRIGRRSKLCNFVSEGCAHEVAGFR